MAEFLDKSGLEKYDGLIKNWAKEQAKVFYVTVQGASGSYTADKTFAEISEAYTNGKAIFCRATFSEGDYGGENTTLPTIMFIPDAGAVFGAVADFNDITVLYTADGTIQVMVEAIAKEADIPAKLPNPKALTFTGAVSGTYDGSSAKTIKIPTLDDMSQNSVNAFYYAEDSGSTADGVWEATVDNVTSLFDGLSVKYKVTVAGSSDGVTFNINGLGAKTVYMRGTTKLTTHFAVNTMITLIYNATNGAWYCTDYDANTKTSSGTSNKTGTKMFLVGGTSQSSSGVTTYSNSKVYIGTDNCLYSNGKKVATADEIPDLISPPVKGVDYFTEADKEEIVQAVITALGTPVFGRVDENNNIILTGELAGGTYTLKYEDSDGTLTEIGTITAGGEEVPTYTNILATALGYDGTILNGVGYIDGYRLTPSQTVASNLSYLSANSDYFATGFIPYTITDAQNKVPFYIKGVNLDDLANYSYSRVIMASNYNTNEYCEHILLSNTEVNGFTISKLGDKYYKITPNSNFYMTGEWRINNAQYIRFSFPQSSGSGVIITINEPIE